MNNYGWGLPIRASSFAGQIDFGILLIHAAMALIFVLWGVFFAYLLVRYRRRAGTPAQREEHHASSQGGFWANNAGELKSLMPDVLVMLFEIALIVFYAFPVWRSIKMSPPDPKDADVVVEVTAEQFAWDVRYPGPDGKFGRAKPELVHFSNPLGLDRTDPAAADDIFVANELHLPVGKKTLIRLRSKDVVHDFFVPEFRLKQDAVPGLEIPMWVVPTRIGHYELACAQLCGFGHSLMRGDVYVESPEDFQKWLASRAALKPAPPSAANNSGGF